MPVYRVQTNFLGSNYQIVNEFPAIREAVEYYKSKIEELEAYHQALTAMPGFKFSVLTMPTRSGGYVVQLTKPRDLLFKTVVNMLVVFRIEKVEIEEHGKTIYVPEDFESVTEALKFAKPGDTVSVANGIYEFNGIPLTGVRIVGGRDANK